MSKGKLKVGTERERHAQWAHHVCVVLIAYFLLAFADLKKMQTNRTYSARYENRFVYIVAINFIIQCADPKYEIF